MGWAEIRIQQYSQGEKANWLERRVLEHANPVHLGLQALGAIPLIYGLWVHNWVLIAVGVLLNFYGHLHCWLKKVE
jgi:hypothetical protein